MAKNFLLNVFDPTDVSSHGASVVVRTMLEATGLAASNLSKQRGVELVRTDAAHTHSTSAAAQAHIDVELFQLVPTSE